MKQQLHTPVLLSILCFLFSIFSQAQEYDWQWAYRGGGTEDSNSSGSGSNITFSNAIEHTRRVIVDSNNNIYFSANVFDYNPVFMGQDITKYGSGYIPNGANSDIYIASLDCEGNFRWHTTIGGESHVEYSSHITADSLGNIYIAVRVINLKTYNLPDLVAPHFAPGVSMGIKANNIPSPEHKALAIIKYDSDGNYLWHTMPQDDNIIDNPNYGIATPQDFAMHDITVHPDGTLLFLLSLGYGSHFDGAFVVPQDTRYTAIFKLDPNNGNYLSHISVPLGGAMNDIDTKMHYDPLNERYYIAVTSYKSTPTTWNGIAITGGGIFALDSQGNELWSHQISDTETNYYRGLVSAVTTDSESNVYIGGSSGNQYNNIPQAQFAGYTFTQSVQSPFLIKLDPEGNLLWGSNLNPGTGEGPALNNDCIRCRTESIAVNGNEVAIATMLGSNHWGDFTNIRPQYHGKDPAIVRFNAQTGECIGINDIMGESLAQGQETKATAIATDHNGNYVVGGYGRGTLFTNHDVIDPLIPLGSESDFFVAKLAKNTDCSIDVCFGIVVPAPTGDSNQTLNAGQTLADLDVEGDNLQWYADAELTEPLSENHIVENNTTYYVTQTLGACSSEALAVTVVISSSNPCQGVEVPTPIGDTSQEVQIGMTLADLEVDGDNLQWYADADLTEPLAETHIVENNTTYYVTQTLGGCTSEALAITVSTLGVADFQKMKIKLYPNPTNGLLYIETSQEIQSYEVYNLIGQRLLSGSSTDSIDMREVSKGTYIIRLTTPNGEVFTEKVIKE